MSFFTPRPHPLSSHPAHTLSFHPSASQVTLTLAFAYLTFFVAEVLRSSGVLAVVGLGVYMSRNGRTRISPQVAHSLTCACT